MSDSTETPSFGRLLTQNNPTRRRPFPKLHHYTSFSAVKEILCSNTLHLSHAAFSNDPTELNYGLDMMGNILRELGLREFKREEFLSILHYHTQPFVFSLTESEDMLSQWERYPGRNGCCITFSDEIVKLIEGDRYALGSVIYEEELQREYLRSLNTQRMGPTYLQQDRISTNLYFLLSTVFLKSSVWSQEKEWRIVRIVEKESFGDIKYQSGTRFLRPYVCLPFKNGPLPITEIRIGPSDDQNRLFRSIQHLVKMTKGYEDVVISRSNIQVALP